MSLLGAGILGVLFGAIAGAFAIVLLRARIEQNLRIELEVARARIAGDEAAARERDQALSRVREQLQGTFSELAHDSLKSNTELFLQLAKERLSRQHQESVTALKDREGAIESLIAPIREALSKTEAQIGAIEKDRIDSFATLKNQIDSLNTTQLLLSRETRNLVTALRRPEVRGQWGEITLRRLVELAGMTAHVDFTEQHHLNTDAGIIRPDMIVHMPDARDIVIDVKTPLDAYLAAVEATNDEERGIQLRRHSQAVAARVRELSSKQYWSQFERSPNFVVLFLPGDQFLGAALQDGFELMDEALRQNVILATPSSLVALLKTVAYGWKQFALAENAEGVRKLGEDLYKRLSVFGDHLQRLGKTLTGSVDAFNKAVGSLEQQVLPGARKFPELGLRIDRTIELLEPVESLVRTPRTARTELSDEPSENST